MYITILYNKILLVKFRSTFKLQHYTNKRTLILSFKTGVLHIFYFLFITNLQIQLIILLKSSYILSSHKHDY